MLKDNQIFIHVPKTGGTTLNCALHGTDIPQKNSFNFRHIAYDTKLSTCGDIFNPLKNDKYRDFKIFMMLRHPVDRILSEYYFIREREEFFSLLKPRPNSFEEYALHAQTNNYVVSFLLGNKIYNKKRPNEDDFEQILNVIEDLNITMGIYEHFEDSLALFQREIGISWPKTIESKRVTIFRPPLHDINQSLYDKIMIKNQWDVKLYEYGLNKFQERNSFGKLSSKIKKNRFDYVLVYTNSHFLLELVMNGHPFLAKHKDYFNELQRYLADLRLSNGEEYLRMYRVALLKALKRNQLDAVWNEFFLKVEMDKDSHFFEKIGAFIFRLEEKKWKSLDLVFKHSDMGKQNWITKWLGNF